MNFVSMDTMRRPNGCRVLCMRFIKRLNGCSTNGAQAVQIDQHLPNRFGSARR
jgi:hypothetical protein